MNIYLMHINLCFLREIKNRVKTHEFRLATLERRDIKVGDLIKLVANENSEEVLVKVTKISYFSSWEEVMDKYYESDFKNVYKNKKEAILGCSQFYKIDDIKQFGIVCFDIVLK